MEVEPGSIVVYSDIACPWSHVAVHRLHETRAVLGLEDVVQFDHRAFPLELFNARPTPKRILDAEIPVAGALEPEARWQMWQRPDHEYPVTMLPALEAVQAAKEQGAAASEDLDRALRRAFFAESKTISMRHVILDVAARVEGLRVDVLAAALDDGHARSGVFEHYRVAQGAEVKGSPHVFLADGSSFHNPGVEIHWEREEGRGFPVVDSNDPSVYELILKTAAG